MLGGGPGSAVNLEATKTPNEAHGDEYWTSLGNLFSNAQELDEDGDTAPPVPLQISDVGVCTSLPATPYLVVG